MAEPTSVIGESVGQIDLADGDAVRPAATARGGRATVRYRLKRLFDIVVAAVLLLLLSPLLAIIALAIRVTGPGPVIYRQQRLAMDRRLFTLYKFRTMVDGADGRVDEVFHLNEANGPLFKIERDPRVTAVGRVLRAAFLDELPQLVNILKGDMSLVGPRPCLPQEAAQMNGDLAFRFSVPQGLTGPWQVNGYHFLTFEDQLRIEWEYVSDWSLRKDFAILIKTIPLAVNLRGI